MSAATRHTSGATASCSAFSLPTSRSRSARLRCPVRVLAADSRLARPQALVFAGPSSSTGTGSGGSQGLSGSPLPRPSDSLLTSNLDAIVAPVAQDMVVMNGNLLSIVGERHPMLKAAASQIFSAGGKKLRPVLCFLVARATAQAMGLRCVQQGASRPSLFPWPAT